MCEYRYLQAESLGVHLEAAHHRYESLRYRFSEEVLKERSMLKKVLIDFEKR